MRIYGFRSHPLLMCMHPFAFPSNPYSVINPSIFVEFDDVRGFLKGGWLTMNNIEGDISIGQVGRTFSMLISHVPFYVPIGF